VLRSLVNYFEFELGAPVETDNSLLGSGSRSGHLGGDGRFGLCVGGAPRTKVIRSSHLWKKLLEKFRVVLGQVFSRLGRKPKLFFGFRLGVGRKAKFSGSRLGPNLGNVSVPCFGPPSSEAGCGEKVDAVVLVSPAEKFADRNPSPAKGMSWRGFFGPKFSFPLEERISEVFGGLPMAFAAVFVVLRRWRFLTGDFLW
jgi:hypothetical protein